MLRGNANGDQIMTVRTGNKTLDIFDNHRRHEKLLCGSVEIWNGNIIALKMFAGKPFFYYLFWSVI